MTEQEVVIFIKNAMQESRNALAELMLLSPKIFEAKAKILGEYYSNLENCKKEIESCDIAIKALEEVQQYRAIGTVEECRAAVEKQKAKKPKEYEDKFYGCPSCGNALLQKWEKYNTKLMDKKNGLPYCLGCGQKLDWSDEE